MSLLPHTVTIYHVTSEIDKPTLTDKLVTSAPAAWKVLIP